MCKHILNAQVSIMAPCCKQWFECPECHDELSDHGIDASGNAEVAFACLACQKPFWKDMSVFDENDQACPHCQNVFVLVAVTPEFQLSVKAEEFLDDRLQLTLDYTAMYDQQPYIEDSS
ncbi:unnamed protein product [Heterosigma akashiwo]|mmetsp:Transcript_21609/g.29683  ORF Transcript_21609/g.29683 Transcript_21609/m.29683 type:complete len:119 (+) Transcript_21609:52-408(+)|eukprot:CAMPEP_0194586444 /NCGR_PEP_ID=MMETSP0292-20121207/18450_1 /TAXON_ID=39354 /ORGANISM="Heterosigma akashiwo, Strain CCMP2393" /LENGTH=118 /DNA_ID=CAMNT_0039442281 /DNA_START=54 /DNA_END=410 /DNA_ORIENTATION=-